MSPRRCRIRKGDDALRCRWPPLLERTRADQTISRRRRAQERRFRSCAPGEIHAHLRRKRRGKIHADQTALRHPSARQLRGRIARRRDAPRRFDSVRDAEAAGIAVITRSSHWSMSSAWRKIFFSAALPRRGWRVDWLEMHRRAAALLADFGLAISPEAPVRTLGIGQKQLVEIVRAIDKKSRVLVLDEPTAALTEQEVHSAARSSPPAARARHGLRLHFPQTRRGVRDRRPHHRAARWREHRDARPRRRHRFRS